jgi:hypothetical protein
MGISMSSTKRYRRVKMDGGFEDVDFDPFVSPDEARQKAFEEHGKRHDEQMGALTQILEHHGKLLEAIHEHLSAPKRIVRDQQGRAVGMEAVSNKRAH